MKLRIFFIICFMFIFFGCATKNKPIDYNSVMESTGVVELDADANGAVDEDKGGTNAQTFGAFKISLSLNNVDNTSDVNKPISSATQSALDGKANSLGADDNYVTDAEKIVIGNTSGTNTGDQTISDATITTTDITNNDVSTLKHGFAPKGDGSATSFLNGTGAYSTPSGGGNVSTSGTPVLNDYARYVNGTDIEGRSYTEVKTDLSLNNVDNTSDANKPVSSATQSALDLKENSLGNPATTGFILSSTDAGIRSWINRGAPTDATYLVSTANDDLSAEDVVSANGLSLVTAVDYQAMVTLLTLNSAFDFSTSLGLTLGPLGSFILEGATEDDFEITGVIADPTADRSLYFLDDDMRVPNSTATNTSGNITNTIYDKTSLVDGSYSGNTIIGYNAGEVINALDLVILDPTTGKYLQADANDTARWPASAIAVEAGTDGNPLIVLSDGIIMNVAWTFTRGDVVYLSTTAGNITTTAPSTTNDCYQPVGRAIETNIVRFNINDITGYGEVN